MIQGKLVQQYTKDQQKEGRGYHCLLAHTLLSTITVFLPCGMPLQNAVIESTSKRDG